MTVPSSLPLVYREENPLSFRLNNIRDLQLRIDQCRKSFLDTEKTFQNRLEELSSQIRKRVYIPWLGKRVELKLAMGLIQERNQILTNRPFMGGDVDLKAEEVCRLRDELLKPISALNDTYEERDLYEMKYQTEMDLLFQEREALIEEYLEYSLENQFRIRLKISTDAYSDIQSLYDLYIAPYLKENMRKRIHEKIASEVKILLGGITQKLNKCLYGLQEIKELIEMESKTSNAFDRSTIVKTIRELELQSNADFVLQRTKAQMEQIRDRIAQTDLCKEEAILRLLRQGDFLFKCIEKFRKEIDAMKIGHCINLT